MSYPEDEFARNTIRAVLNQPMPNGGTVRDGIDQARSDAATSLGWSLTRVDRVMIDEVFPLPDDDLWEDDDDE